MTILVTGGAGFIGSHTCKALARQGFLPVVYDNLSTGHKSFVKWGPLVVGDLHDHKKLHETFLHFKPVGVLHFAANAVVVESMSNPGKYYHNNVGGSIALLEAMREHKTPYLVFSSSCATYGHPQFSPITETHPQIPISPYGRSKLMIEQAISDYSIAYGLAAMTLRYFNAAGADFEENLGEDQNPQTRLIPSVIEAALKKRKEIVVYGTDFPTHDGSAIRDYIHVSDLADAHVKALKWLFANKRTEQVNLGTGVGLSVLDIIQEVSRFSSREISARHEAKRPGEPSHAVADNRKARELLDWTPSSLSSLPELISSAWQWQTRCY